MSQLASIGDLHRRRADSAAKDVKNARMELDRAEQGVAESQDRLEIQRVDAAQQEREIDASLFSSVVKRRNLDDAMVDLQMIKQATLAMELALLETEQHRDRAQAALINAQARYREKLIKLEKYESLIERETQETNTAAQATEDALLDEAIELMRKTHEH